MIGADDEGRFDVRNVAANAIYEDNTGSRWSADGLNRWLTVELGSVATVTDIAVSYYNDHKRTSDFYIQTSMDNLSWTTVLDLTTTEQKSSSGPTPQQFDVINSNALYVRLVGMGNSSSGWNSITDFQVIGCSDKVLSKAAVDAVKAKVGGDPALKEDSTHVWDSLLTTVTPAENFDLTRWYLSVATPDTTKDPISGTEGNYEYPATSISVEELNGHGTDYPTPYELADIFYTGADGGMVFTVSTNGARTSTNTKYTRTELRGMLRGPGNESLADTQGVNKNNWVFSSTTAEAQNAAGGVDGVLRATLAVNEVSELGKESVVGRVIIGQIHANDDEPLRLYYRKLPGHSVGAVYMAHEAEARTLNGEISYDLIGSRYWTGSDNPTADQGIALDEKFSYEVRVEGDLLLVTVYKQGQDPVTQVVTMYESGYDNPDQYMYFKAGVYNQNDASDSKAANSGTGEPVTATFYYLDATYGQLAD